MLFCELKKEKKLYNLINAFLQEMNNYNTEKCKEGIKKKIFSIGNGFQADEIELYRNIKILKLEEELDNIKELNSYVHLEWCKKYSKKYRRFLNTVNLAVFLFEFHNNKCGNKKSSRKRVVINNIIDYINDNKEWLELIF